MRALVVIPDARPTERVADMMTKSDATAALISQLRDMESRLVAAHAAMRGFDEHFRDLEHQRELRAAFQAYGASVHSHSPSTTPKRRRRARHA